MPQCSLSTIAGPGILGPGSGSVKNQNVESYRQQKASYEDPVLSVIQVDDFKVKDQKPLLFLVW